WRRGASARCGTRRTRNTPTRRRTPRYRVSRDGDPSRSDDRGRTRAGTSPARPSRRPPRRPARRRERLQRRRGGGRSARKQHTDRGGEPGRYQNATHGDHGFRDPSGPVTQATHLTSESPEAGFLNRELSQLDLVGRVLDLAGDAGEPLLERVK